MNRYKLAKCLYILPKVCCFFSGKDSDYKKHIINPIKKEKAYPNRLPLQAYRITYLHTVNIVAAMSRPKLNTFFIKILPKSLIYKPIKKDTGGVLLLFPYLFFVQSLTTYSYRKGFCRRMRCRYVPPLSRTYCL